MTGNAAAATERWRWWPFSEELRYASVRIRCRRVISALKARGVDAALYDAAGPAPAVLVLSKRYDRASLALASRLQQEGTRVVLDLCDNHFHAETPNAASDMRASELRAALRLADMVIASTPALANVLASEAPVATDIRVIGDAYEEPFDAPQRWTLQRIRAEAEFASLRTRLLASRRTGTARLLWFGQHGSAQATGGMLDVLSVMDTLNLAACRQPLSLTIISNHRGKFQSLRQAAQFPTFYLEWNQTTFSRAARLHDIAILPVQPNPFTLCKTNNRVTTALLHGLAVIADAIPSYEEFAPAVRLGDWPGSLQALGADREVRRRAVAAGLERVHAHWSIDRIAARWQTELGAVSSGVTPEPDPESER